VPLAFLNPLQPTRNRLESRFRDQLLALSDQKVNEQIVEMMAKKIAARSVGFAVERLATVAEFLQMAK
jgi:hypothetical protein